MNFPLGLIKYNFHFHFHLPAKHHGKRKSESNPGSILMAQKSPPTLCALKLEKYKHIECMINMIYYCSIMMTDFLNLSFFMMHKKNKTSPFAIDRQPFLSAQLFCHEGEPLGLFPHFHYVPRCHDVQQL